MIRQIRHAIMIISVIAIAITASCYTDLENDFQQLESTDSTSVKLVNVTDAATSGSQEIYKAKMVAQQFTITDSFRLQGAQLKLKRVGDFSSVNDPKIFIKIYDDDGSNNPVTGTYPNSVYADVNEIIETDPVSTGEYVPLEFSIKPTLSPGKYWLVLKFTDENDGSPSQYIQYYLDGASSQGLVKYNDGGGWVTETGDMGIIIWGRPVN